MAGIRDVRLLALTPAMVFLTPTMTPFISLTHRFLYHQDGSAATVLLALLANLAVVWMVFLGVFRLAARAQWFAVPFWTLFLACLPAVLLRDWASLTYRTVPGWAHRGAVVIAVTFLVFTVAGWKSAVKPNLPVILSRLTALTGFISLGWLVTVLQLVSYTVLARRLDAEPVLHRQQASFSTTQGAPVRPRVVWVIMDELGYKPAFADRFGGLRLPAFDALAAQSTNFTQASSPGLSTEEVIPELIMGRPVPSVALNAGGSFQFRTAPGGALQTLRPNDTVFADALHDGYSTAVDGWFNPYCRLFGEVLDGCFWISRTNSVTPDFDSRASFLSNLEGPARHVWRDIRLGKAFVADADRHEAALHIEDLSSILKAADETIADPTKTFVLIHLPVPHPGGIYDRTRAALSTGGSSSYVDNLALADRVLAHLRDELAQRGEWDRAAVVIMGDHSWRTTMRWIPTRSWTKEDQAASRGGGFDPRPAYLVKLPGQSTGAAIDQPYQTVRTRALLDEIMAGRIRTPADLQSWVAQR